MTCEATKIQGDEEGNNYLANVNIYRELMVALTKIPGLAGYVVPVAELGPSNGGQDANISRFPRVSEQNKWKVGADVPVFWEVFNGTNINRSLFAQYTSGMTIAQTGNYLVLNSGSSVTSTNYASFHSYRTFQLYGIYPVRLDFRAKMTNGGATNKNIDIGLMLGPDTFVDPLDGVYFRWKSDGFLYVVVNNNAVTTETQIALTEDSTNNHYTLIINNDSIEVWVNEVFQVLLELSSGNELLTRAGSQHFVARVYNDGTASAAAQVRLSEVVISVTDMDWNKKWGAISTGFGRGSYQTQSGTASGMTTNWANSVAPASAALSNTAAGYTTIGGQFQWAAVAGAETDYALFVYLVPQATTSVVGKSFYITEVKIDTYNTGAANATTATVMQWALAVGGTQVSLATVDGASDKAPRRIPLGVQSIDVTGAIGFACVPINVTFDTPPVSDPLQYVHIIVKIPIGTATGSQVIRGTVMINGYFE